MSRPAHLISTFSELDGRQRRRVWHFRYCLWGYTLYIIDILDADEDALLARLEIDPNGTSLYMTYLKTQLPGYTGYRFPKFVIWISPAGDIWNKKLMESPFFLSRIPNGVDGTFARLGYNKHPTFFGCNDPIPTPLVVYLPNYYSVAETDIPSTETTYSVSFYKSYSGSHFLAPDVLVFVSIG